MISVQDIITRVTRQFGDESGVQVTEQDILIWVNDAAREICLQHDNLIQKTGYLDSVVDQQEYDLPSDLLSLSSVAYRSNSNGSYYELRFMPPKAMNEYLNGWDGTDYPKGVPYFYARGENTGTLLVHPKPETDLTDAIKLVYTAYPVLATTLEDSLDLPAYYFNTVLEFCLMKAYELDEDWEAVQRKAQYVQSTIDANATREAWFGRETYPSVVPTSEDYI